MLDISLENVAINVRTKSRKTSSGLELANSPLTRAYLEAGRRLAEAELLGDLPEGKQTFRPLSTLTRKGIINEAEAILRQARSDERVARALYGAVSEKERLKTEPTVGTFRDRWDVLPLYLGDLVRYVLQERYSLTDGMLNETTRAELSETPAFSVAVAKVAYQDMRVVYADETSARFQHLITALADVHEEIRTALGGVYEHSFTYWRGVYAEILEARGVSLRPDVTLDDLTVILSSMAEGLSLRHIGATSGRVVDNRQRHSLLGKATQIIIAGAIDPGSGQEVAAVVDELMAIRQPLPADPAKPSRHPSRIRRPKNGQC